MEVYNWRKRLETLKNGSIIKDYVYKYYDITSDGCLVPNHNNETYGMTREGYEKFKKEGGYNVGHSGITSLRELHRDGELIGFIAEKRLETRNVNTEMNLLELLCEVEEEFCKVFNIDNPVKRGLVEKIMLGDDFYTKYNNKSKIEFMLNNIEEVSNFSGEELDTITSLIVDIGNLQLRDS